ncbi:hypothetical protein GOB94_15485 [Granulicella sp. 5B5]|uniref:universal stress protein n=1 Tax=Granulicella sp. 5B5 TaxID=1617967 RepID=UPI0015F5781F|nr:universal stress protein [Granulicella sp. 5B5]QMV19924.1 hypothetical protein GOB94_15485 [Granulicella sp. 5B5]
MSLLDRILFPVDFSPSSSAMAAYVKRAAAIFHAHVTLVHVAELNLYTGMELGLRAIEDVAKDQLQAARERLGAYLTADLPLATTTRLVYLGDPATQIAQAARDIRASLIIMPTHAGIFRQTLLGSTTAKVLDSAACPVLTSRHAETIAPRPIEHREWLCALGLTADSERVLRFAAQVSTEARGHISLIHAVQVNQQDLPIELDLQGTIESIARNRATRELDELKQKVGVEAPVTISLGNVKQALLDAASNFDADLLMIGRSPHSTPLGRLRDLTYAVIRDSPFPVLSI